MYKCRHLCRHMCVHVRVFLWRCVCVPICVRSGYLSSCTRCAVMRAPEAPRGCPMAMAPPFTLHFSGSRPSALDTARYWAANASFTCHTHNRQEVLVYGQKMIDLGIINEWMDESFVHTSTKSMSCRVRPAFFRASVIAGTGPVTEHDILAN